MTAPHELVNPLFTAPLRNVAYPGDPMDLDLHALFTTDRGKRVLAHLVERGAAMTFLAAEIDAAIKRVHAHCGTGSLTPS